MSWQAASFDGDFKSQRNVNLSRKSGTNKAGFLEKRAAERDQREQQRRRKVASSTIQVAFKTVNVRTNEITGGFIKTTPSR